MNPRKAARQGAKLARLKRREAWRDFKLQERMERMGYRTDIVELRSLRVELGNDLKAAKVAKRDAKVAQKVGWFQAEQGALVESTESRDLMVKGGLAVAAVAVGAMLLRR